MGGFIVTVAVILAPTPIDARLSMAFWLILFMMVSAWRLTYSMLTNAILPVHQRVLIVGTGTRSRAIAEIMEQSTDLSYQILGYIHCNTPQDRQGIWGTPVLGEVDDLAKIVEQSDVHQVVVAADEQIDDNLFHSLIHCQSNGVVVSWMPDLYEKLCYRIPVQHIDPSWGLYAMQDRPIFRRLHLTSKRIMDLTLFVFALPVFAIVRSSNCEAKLPSCVRKGRACWLRIQSWQARMQSWPARTQNYAVR